MAEFGQPGRTAETTQENIEMLDDMPESKWKQVSGQIQIYWSKIDGDDLQRIAGKADRLAGVLQHKYGYTKEHAESQSIRWMRKHREDQAIEE